MASPAKKAKTDLRQPCPYGAVCYRKNPMHFKEFSHPGDTDHKPTTKDDNATTTVPITVTTVGGPLPPCKYGVHCYRTNLLHFAEYSHYIGTAASAAATPAAVAQDDSDTDDCDSDDESKRNTDGKSTEDEDDLLKPGASLKKTYSKMTEKERKELIQKAFAAKEKLQQKIEATKKELEEKDKQLGTLNEELKTGTLLMDGEREALEGTKTVYFPLAPERTYKEGSAAQMHYRLAESQFYRLVSGAAASLYRVTKVEYVVTPHLVKNFRAAQEKLKKTRGEKWASPVLGFHGTNEANIVPIVETGFKVPGEDGFHHKTDSGYFGAGVYFSEYPTYSMGYINGSQKLMLCQVLPGMTFQCAQLMMGAKLQPGYDSHISPNKKELIIFSSHHILPCYIVYFANTASSQFVYTKARLSKRRRKVPTGSDALKLLYAGTVHNKRMLANNAPLTKVFEGVTFKYAGLEKESKNLFKLIAQHKGKKGTGAKYDVLIAVPGLNETNNKQVEKALEKDLPIVKEDFVYECIVHKKYLDLDYFLHELYDQ